MRLWRSQSGVTQGGGGYSCCLGNVSQHALQSELQACERVFKLGAQSDISSDWWRAVYACA